MATIDLSALKNDHVGWTGWDSDARSEPSSHLRRTIGAAPSTLNKLKRAARLTGASV
jgi:hypothetical protein